MTVLWRLYAGERERHATNLNVGRKDSVVADHFYYRCHCLLITPPRERLDLMSERFDAGSSHRNEVLNSRLLQFSLTAVGSPWILRSLSDIQLAHTRSRPQPQ